MSVEFNSPYTVFIDEAERRVTVLDQRLLPHRVEHVDLKNAQEAAEARSKVTAALKEVGKAWQVSNAQRDEALAQLFGKELPDALARRRFDAFVKAVGAGIIKSGSRVDVARRVRAATSQWISAKSDLNGTRMRKKRTSDSAP